MIKVLKHWFDKYIIECDKHVFTHYYIDIQHSCGTFEKYRVDICMFCRETKIYLLYKHRNTL